MDQVTFSFGRNWYSFVESMPDSAIESAQEDIIDWVGESGVRGRSVIDVGCGSGLSSACLFAMGASTLQSFDLDFWSIESTKIFRKRAGDPENWTLQQGSILDEDFVAALPRADLVYAWGVLHHTGDMWRAVEHAAQLVDLDGHLWLALYTKGPRYAQDLALKQRYNRVSRLGKKWMIYRGIFHLMRRRWRAQQNPFAWNQRRARGMGTYHDLVDWLGGLPYEVASPQEVTEFLSSRGFLEVRLDQRPERRTSRYLFKRIREPDQDPQTSDT